MKFRVEDLPIPFQNQRTTRAAFFDFSLTESQKNLLLNAIDSVFSESQRKKRVNGYVVARLLALVGLKFDADKRDHKFVKTNELVNLFLENGTQVAKGSLNAALQLLVKNKLLVSLSVEVDSNLRREWTVYQFAADKQLSDIITDANFVKYAPEAASANQKKRKRSDDIKEQEQILDLVSIGRDDATLSRSHLPKGIAYLEQVIPPAVWALSHNKDGPHNVDYKREVVDGYVVEIKGHKKITTKPSLITGLILMQIAIAYNAKMLSQRKFKKPFDQRDIPIFSSDLMSFKGSDSGPARERTANEIELLRNTVFDIHDMNATFSHHEQREKYTKTDYRMLESVRSSSDVRYSTDDPGAHIRSASLYIIRFSEDVEKLLSQEQVMFSLPSRLLSAHNLLVTFYLHLRRQRVDKKIIAFEELIHTLPFAGSALTLSDRLQKILQTPVKTENDKKENFATSKPDFDYNLFGYYIKFIDHEGKPAIDVRCDKREMIEAAGLKFNDTPGAVNAPTMANPLIWLSQTSDEIEHTKEIQHAVDMLKKDLIVAKSLRNSRYRMLSFEQKTVFLTAYCNEVFIKALSYELEQVTFINKETLEEAILTIQAELNPIKIGKIVIDSEDIESLIKYLTARCNRVPTEQDIVIHTSSFRQKKILQWKAREFSAFAESLIEDINKNSGSL
ncbi:replication initiator protein RctB domain-containing protein [Vibrio owensii]|uniref:replication initiator protein RctB domain-containing protein n=1 Tax=Vibrio owensii TaxID=696485 RepID=UPI0018F2435A|nr:replication initiator protein RctB domain-containing protein [Vibrio owensii]